VIESAFFCWFSFGYVVGLGRRAGPGRGVMIL
jgi:hypothetical protein